MRKLPEVLPAVVSWQILDIRTQYLIVVGKCSLKWPAGPYTGGISSIRAVWMCFLSVLIPLLCGAILSTIYCCHPRVSLSVFNWSKEFKELGIVNPFEWTFRFDEVYFFGSNGRNHLSRQSAPTFFWIE